MLTNEFSDHMGPASTISTHIAYVPDRSSDFEGIAYTDIHVLATLPTLPTLPVRTEH